MNEPKDGVSERPAWMTADDLWQSVSDAVPLPMFIVDGDMRIKSFNPAATDLLGRLEGTVLRRRGGEAWECIHRTDSAEGCGRGPHCGECVLHKSVKAALDGRKTTRERTTAEFERANSVRATDLLVSASPMTHNGEKLAVLILEDITELSTLRRLLPICANCKKVRDDDNYWHSVERFFETRLSLDFTHGLCPECIKKLYPELQ